MMLHALTSLTKPKDDNELLVSSKSKNNKLLTMQYIEEAPPPKQTATVDQQDAGSLASRKTASSATASLRGGLTEAQEAELLSKATSQAMIAARSILLSGGTEATALSTAKAAAHSILVPRTSEMDGPALGKLFLSRRKAKRQAEVVASMALLSVKQQTRHQPPIAMQHSQQMEASSFMQGAGSSRGGGGPQTYSNLSVMTSDSNYQQQGRGRSSTPVSQMMQMRQGGNPVMQHYARSPSPSSPVSYQTRPTPRNDTGVHQPIYQSARDRSLREHSSPQRSLSPVNVTADRGTPPMNNKSRMNGEWLRKKIAPQQAPSTGPPSDWRSMRPPKPTSKVPSELPKSRQHQPKPKETEDLAKSVPEEDPIYYNISPKQTKSFMSGSDGSSEASQTDDSGTYGSDTVEDLTTVAPAIEAPHRTPPTETEPNFLNESVDPFLVTLTNIFFCGGPSYEPDEAARDKKQRDHEVTSRDESRNDCEQGEGLRSGRDLGEEGKNNSPRQGDLGVKSKSTATDISAIFRDLASSEEESEMNTRPALKSSIRESMEQVVLRALSGGARDVTYTEEAPRDEKPIDKKQAGHQPQPAVERCNQVDITPDHASSASSLTASSKGHLQALSQRMKFRRWMKKRRGQNEVDFAEE